MFNNIIKGLQAYPRALTLLSTLKLWKYFVIPIVISVVVAIAVAFAAYGWSDNVGAIIAKIWIWEWGKETFITIGTFLGGLIILVIGLILYKHIIMALSAPFMSPVSEKIEAHLRGATTVRKSEASFQTLLWRGIRINLRNLIKELLLTLPLLLLKFIPGVNIFSAALLFLLQAYYAGFGNMDYTLERYYMFNDSVRFVQKNRGVAIGNGIGFLLLLLIPVIGIILVLPLSVTASTISTVEVLDPNMVSKND
ncbi:EI24 domain-containing protein [Flavobacteriaceae bacterium S356]|uniref:EI24 domain-containing protein n=1 Tax=Asprobacillus argus TaxID=3076534 RepID=A0ABU3LI77_9FLAO|nr:EI24 domain-containing protein [Flavobacteriaceae bacterium S356]